MLFKNVFQNVEKSRENAKRLLKWGNYWKSFFFVRLMLSLINDIILYIFVLEL